MNIKNLKVKPAPTTPREFVRFYLSLHVMVLGLGVVCESIGLGIYANALGAIQLGDALMFLPMFVFPLWVVVVVGVEQLCERLTEAKGGN